MARIIKLCLFLLIPLSSWAFDPFPEEKKTSTPPNPYELTLGWWEYYQVDSKELAERKKDTNAYFKKIQEKIPPELEKKAQPYFEHIDVGLSLLIQLKEASPKVPPTLPPVKEKYTYQEWIHLSKSLQEEKEKLQYLTLRLDLANSSYKSASNHLDSQFAEYLKGKSTDPDRLIKGLEIIQNRIFISTEKIQIGNLESVLRGKSNQVSHLQQQIDQAYRKIDFTTISFTSIEQELENARSKEAKAKHDYLFNYEKIDESSSISSYENEELDETLLNIKLNYEISRVEVINLQIQREILSWVEEKEPYSRKAFQKKISSWQSIIYEIRKDVPNSEESSELILQQSLKNLVLQQQSQYHISTDQSLELAENAITKIEQLKNLLAINAFLFEQLDEFRKSIHFSFYDWIIGGWETLIDLIKTNTEWFNRALFRIGEFPITPLSIFKFIIVLAIAFILGKLARYYTFYFGKKQRRIPARSIHVLSRVINYFVIVIGFIVAGYSIGFNVTIFAYIAGALAIWVGLGLQSIFHNFISGMIVLATKTIRVHDMIQLDTGEIGTVTDLNLRTTIIRTFDEKEIVIPNADIVNKKFYNLTLSSYTLRIKIPFRIGFNEDKEKVEKIVVEAAKKVKITSEVRTPEIWLTGFGENYINVELVVWINTLLREKTASWYSQYYWAIDDAFRENGVEMPVPVQTIRISDSGREYPIGAAEPMPIKLKDTKPGEPF